MLRHNVIRGLQLGAVLVVLWWSCGIYFIVFVFFGCGHSQMVAAANKMNWAKVRRLAIEGAGLNELNDNDVCGWWQQ